MGGKASLTVKDQYNYRHFTPVIFDSLDVPPPPGGRPLPSSVNGIVKTAPLENGKAIFRFTENELRLARLTGSDASNNIALTGTVEEDLTGIKRNGTASLTVYKEDTKVKLDKSTDTFKPGLPYKLVVSVVQPDDTPIPASYPRRVQFETTFF